MLYSEMTDKIINSFYKVYNVLGYGFLEKVYENSLAIELKSAGFAVLQQQNIKVYYENQVVGDYFGKKPDFKRAIFSNERREISETEASNLRESAQSASSEFYSSG